MSANVSTSSRVGRKPVTIPAGVDVKIQGDQFTVKGPKGQLSLSIHPYVQVEVDSGDIKIKPNSNNVYCRSGTGKKLLNSIPGTMRSKISNAVHGVTKGFEQKLTLVGVGYRAQMKGKTLSLSIGYSHPVEFVTPEGLTIATPTQTEIVITGPDKFLVGHKAAEIISIRPPEPYKGKGIVGKKPVRRKETKKK